MAYQGISPDLYRNNLTNVQLLDDIGGSFNGTTTQFNLTVNGSAFHAVSARSLFIVLGGIVQEPDQDYTVSGGVITFTTAPNAGLTFSGRNIYGLNQLTGVNDGLVTPAKLSLGGPSWNTDGDLILSGDATNVYVNTDTPTVRPTLDLNFERDRRLDSRITYSRSSTATYLGSDGLIKTALVNEPRFEYDINGNCKGLLSEESRSNILVRSQEFDNASWAKQNCSVTSNDILAPDGTLTADRITATVNDDVVVSQTYTAAFNASTLTYSIFAKAGTYRYLAIQSFVNIWSSAIVFDLQTGTASARTTSDGKTFSMIPYPNGWYRCIVSYPANYYYYFYFQFGLTNYIGPSDGGVSSATSPAVGEYIYVWGAQTEAGFFPTSYIPTTTSSVTRSSDITTISGTNFSDWYNQSEGTVYSTFNANYVGSSDGGRLFRIANDTNFGANRVDYVVTQTGNYQPYLASSGTNYYNGPSTIGFSANTNYKIGVTLKQNDITGYVNSSLSTFDNTWVPFTANHLSLGTTIDSRFLNGCIKRFTYYPKRLTNNQLSNLTS